MATPQAQTQQPIPQQQPQSPVPQELTQQQALELLVNGVQVAQQKGAYNLNEAELLARACRVFVRQPAPTPTPAPAQATPPAQTQGLQTPVPQPPPVNDPQNVQTI